MKSFKFTPEDFWTDKSSAPHMRLTTTQFCELANKRLKEWLDAATTVWLVKDNNGYNGKEQLFNYSGHQQYGNFGETPSSHTAKIVCIEELKEKK